MFAENAPNLSFLLAVEVERYKARRWNQNEGRRKRSISVCSEGEFHTYI